MLGNILKVLLGGFKDTGGLDAALLETLQAMDVDVIYQLVKHTAQPDDDVLEDTHRADHRAVDAPEEQTGQQDDGDHDEIQRQRRRQELEFGHPSPPVVADAHEQQRNPHQEQGRQGNAEFS